MDNRQIIVSDDGSHTILSETFGVTYHSTHGAIQETQTVFIDAGLSYHSDKGKTRINILEMGFGTGLNALMAYLWSINNSISLDYHTIEAFPLDMDQVSQLNYTELLSLGENEREDFHRMHEVEDGIHIQLSGGCTFTKYLTMVEDITLPKDYFDAIFFDAFAPNTQAHLWEAPIITKMYESLSDGGCLTTYCAKGSFKRALKAAGFRLESLPGPKGKREMTRGIKDS